MKMLNENMDLSTLTPSNARNLFKKVWKNNST